jgi:uncharacterized metal-binding protein YceD (DUF177 family)
VKPEFSRPVAVTHLTGPVERRIVADEAERAALARRFSLVALESLEAEVRLVPLALGVRLEADFSAAVVQECVLTLEPVHNHIQERFSLLYGEAADGSELDPEAELVEPLQGEEIDIGEAVAQQLSLALDPYPRAPGAVLPEHPEPLRDSPFAGLAKLKLSG